MDFTKYIDQGILIASEFVKAHGQQSWDTVLLLVRMSAWSSIAWGVLFAVLFVSLIPYAKRSASHIFRMIEIENEYVNTYMNMRQRREKWKAENLNGFQIAYASFQSVGLLISGLGTLNLLDMWLWVQAFYPELWLAKQAINKVIN